MAAKKTKVVFIKRVEDRDKTTGAKTVIKAGTKTEMTAAEIKKNKTRVRVIEDDAKEDSRPVLASGAAPDASGDASDEGEGDDETGGDGATGD
ncbi:hypothetical protein [Marinobacter sp. DS40M6]|uniref:hypothetical protein n=1 Tax=Marinobacter sp. DS40M6 TaxID=1597776 RepID=UPI0023583D30|nr:hypothetical protein [Marinobacter sp. DS40M6]MDC8455335.1 hypothetical protein [Marinobacter sp. DS40M6]